MPEHVCQLLDEEESLAAKDSVWHLYLDDEKVALCGFSEPYDQERPLTLDRDTCVVCVELKKAWELRLLRR